MGSVIGFDDIKLQKVQAELAKKYKTLVIACDALRIACHLNSDTVITNCNSACQTVKSCLRVNLELARRVYEDYLESEDAYISVLNENEFTKKAIPNAYATKEETRSWVEDVFLKVEALWARDGENENE